MSETGAPATPPRISSKSTYRTKKWLVGLLTVALMTTPLSASAVWNESITLPRATLSTAKVPATAQPLCESKSGINLIGIPIPPYTAEISWGAVDGAAKYQLGWIDAENEFHEIMSTSRLKVTMGQGLVGGLVEGLVNLLVGGSSAELVIRAEHESGWVSVNSQPVKIKSTGLILGLLAGFKCA